MDSDKVSGKQFRKWVQEEIDGLPDKYLKHINNLAVFVEDFPTQTQLNKLRLRSGYGLFGLYEGYHQSLKLNVGAVMPDRITIFRMPIMRYCQNENEVKAQIKSTVIHEIAHHFGSGEEGASKASHKFSN
jgi:predicted Zn-dependent protease with MMP-like domain